MNEFKTKFNDDFYTARRSTTRIAMLSAGDGQGQVAPTR